jgi:hypothetical protein
MISQLGLLLNQHSEAECYNNEFSYIATTANLLELIEAVETLVTLYPLAFLDCLDMLWFS